MVMNDRLTEYPLVINTLKRFNLYPEVVLASWYRVYTAIMGVLGIATKMCWFGRPSLLLCHIRVYTKWVDAGFVFYLRDIFKSTRVMWTPPLRESFSYPFLVLQMLLLTYILRSPRPGKFAFVALGVSNVFFMLPWQFAQFVLLTQISLLVCFVLMFGNAMLLTSFYASSLVTIWGIIENRTQISQFCKTAVLTCVAQGVGWLISTVFLKFLTSVILGVSDDAHISNLIKSKFTSYKDFDTLMYTCAAEFDFIEKETPVKYLKTLLLPIILCVSVVIIEKLFGWIKWQYNHHGMVLVIIVVMSVQGLANLRNQWSIMGEFSNIPQEELLEWIKANTKPDDVFAGAMPTMASVKLSAERPVVNHPHYEDAGLRARTKLVYSMYSRKTAEEVKWNLMKLEVDYFVLEDSWCTRRTRPGCSMPEIWDIEDPHNVGKTPICTLLAINPQPHFVKVFENNVYSVLKLTKDT
ncbi:putative C-mannosyltransferase DPY19L1 [Acipenser ruthenus]|uniref:Putative C-mannosyltransferase DPY19L1 n=1 Tax=Acipenser ruthenus TaxID=7906 RepID=A0A444TW76_ACIRT|nr:putative C-mannosyltransferase DPY19L1 [Acipenser ruthenus]